MIEKLIKGAIENALWVTMMVLGIIVWGVYGMLKLPVDAVPDITNNQVQVITTSQNLAAPEVEQWITVPVELAMGNLQGVKEIRSISRFGLSVVTLVFEDEMGTYLPRQLVAEKLQEVRASIDPKMGEPEMGPITTGLGEVFQYTLEADSGFEEQYSAADLRSINDWIVKRQMTMIEGVVEVSSWGGEIEQWEVSIEPEVLKAHGLTLMDVYSALQKNNENAGGSYLEKGSHLYYIRTEGLLSNLDQIKQISLPSLSSVPLTIGDIAQVQRGTAPRFGAATANGRGETTVGVVMMLKNANSNQVVQGVQKRIREIGKSLPKGVHIKPFIERSKLVQKTASTVAENLSLGGLIVILTLIFFLGNWRAGALVASVIPLSMLFALGMMHSFGVSANLMSLGALDFGIIVDGAVIIIEFMVVLVLRNWAEMQQMSPDVQRSKLKHLSYESGTRMMKAAIFGQVIILIVFIPILSLDGIEGKMFVPMALTFCFAILGAMLLCLTYVPVVASRFLYSPTMDRQTWGERWLHQVQHRYESALSRLLNHKRIILGSALALLVFSGLVFMRLGGEFIPQLDEGDFALEVRLPTGSSLSEVVKQTSHVEALLKQEFPEVVDVVSKIGAGEIPTDPMPIERADVIVTLKPQSEWISAESKAELAEKMQEALAKLPGVAVEFSQPIEMRFNELMTGVKQDIAVKIFGEDLDELQRLGQQASRLISKNPGAESVQLEQLTGLPQLTVSYDRARLAEYGVSVAEANALVQTAFAGLGAGTVLDGGKRLDLVIRLSKEARSEIETLRRLPVSTAKFGQVPLYELAQVELKESPGQISRDNTHRRIVLGVNVKEGYDTESLVHELQAILEARLKLPEGYSMEFGGQYENLESAKARLSIAVPISLGLIFLILFLSLQSFSQALLIYSAIPFAAVGGILSLYLRQLPFSISAGVGFIALFGVAVLNGLIMMSSLNELRVQSPDLPLIERIKRAAGSRIRPIFLTALVDILGFLPMALSQSAGAEVQRPLATVVIGGLFTSTLLTLVVLPVLYRIWEERKSGMKPVIAAIAVFILGSPLQAQPLDTVNRNWKTLSPEQIVQMAVENQRSNLAAEMNAEAAAIRVQAAWSLPRTEFVYQQGQYNSPYKDKGLSVNQAFDFPMVYQKRRQWLQTQSGWLQQQAQWAKIESKAYAEELIADAWRMVQEQRANELWERQLTEYLRLMKLRVEAGANMPFEQMGLESQLSLAQSERKRVEAQYRDLERRLAVLLASDEPLRIDWSSYQLNALPEWKDSAQGTALYAAMLDQQLELQRDELAQLRAERYPQGQIGYSRLGMQGDYEVNGQIQSYGPNQPFQYWSLDLQVPLLGQSYRKQIQAGEWELQAAQLERDQAMAEWLADVQQCRNWMLHWSAEVKAFEEVRLPASQAWYDAAAAQFKRGDLDFAGFMQALEQYRSTQIHYWNSAVQAHVFSAQFQALSATI